MLWTAGWPAAAEHAGDLISDNVKDIGDIWAGKVPWMLQNLSNPVTMCHGDFRADNLMIDGDRPVAIDFQIVGTGSGMYDVGYFISQSITTAVRRGHDKDLVDTYLNRLEFHGVDIDRDEAWRQYLISITFCVTYGVTSFASYTEQNERGQDLIREMFLRALSCVEDNSALSVIR
jgi:thiamine kinase-like enzyme